METAIGMTNWVLDKLLKKLSNELVAAYVASSELGQYYVKITTDLKHTIGLLQVAQERDVSNNSGLLGLLEDLSKKADEAEDALDEIHYFMIKDQLDGTRNAVPEVGHNLCSDAQHGLHATRAALGKVRTYFSCSHSQDVVHVAPVANKPRNTNKPKFNRADMSNKIKSISQDIHSLCPPISSILDKIPSRNLPGMADTHVRPHIGDIVTQDKLYGRSTIFNKTINDITSRTRREILSILTIDGLGGIGKTTFAQHLYNDKRTKKHFSIRVWVSVRNNFDVVKLTKEILGCITAVKNGGNIREDETDNFAKLQNSVAVRLKSRRFLIVLDDIWECSEGKWETMLAPFRKAEAEKGSMVLVTTRFPSITARVNAVNQINLQGLEPSGFWEFFKVCVFGEVRTEHEGDLVDIARKIADKLKCSPLAAKSVGRLLKNKYSREHWMEILEKREWLNQQHENDIMPALKISYDYLPFHLKKCFSYFSLYPKDNMFDKVEITRFWIAVGILDCEGANGEIEAVGSQYLKKLADSGFIKESGDYYTMHDLFHELSCRVSSKECANINSSFSSCDIPKSIRHLAITMQNKCAEAFMEEMSKLVKKIDVGSLRSLMIFGEYESDIVDRAFEIIFKKIKSLRVLFLFMNSPKTLVDNFSQLIHLRYLKIESPINLRMSLPMTISTFYHLKFLNLERWNGNHHLPKSINRLVYLRHFLARKEFHSNVPWVGKMECLEELKEFHVKKDDVGFELSELGKLNDLGGGINICNLENVRTMEEAYTAELMNKRNLRKLTLVWNSDRNDIGADVIDALQPHPNLKGLAIINHSSPVGPRWLCPSICTTSLESLHLEGISWSSFPPFQEIPLLKELKFKNIATMKTFGSDHSGGVTDSNSFIKLETILFHDMPELVNWVAISNSDLFSGLKSIECVNCPKLTALPFSECSSPSTQNINTVRYPNLCSLEIRMCPKLLLPPIPHTSTLADVLLGEDSWTTLSYIKAGGSLTINGYKGDLAFHNLAEVKSLRIEKGPRIVLTDLQKLNSLIKLHVCGRDNLFSGEQTHNGALRLVPQMFQNDNVVFRSIRQTLPQDNFVLRSVRKMVLHGNVALCSVKMLTLDGFHPSGQLLSNVFRCLPALSELNLVYSNEDHVEHIVQFPYSSSLEKLQIYNCKNMILSMEDGGLQGLSSLKSLKVRGCGRIFSRWSRGDGRAPFPASLTKLIISKEPTMKTMAMLSNLKSLTHLELRCCNELRMDGFDPRITLNLETLVIDSWYEDIHDDHVSSEGQSGTSWSVRSIAQALLRKVAWNNEMPAGSFKCLNHLQVDTISAVLVGSVCRLLSATLMTLNFYGDTEMQTFSDEQEEALLLLTTLIKLEFVGCTALQALPERLHRSKSLKVFYVSGCHGIKALPNNGLPTSLEMLQLLECSNELFELRQQLKQKYLNLDLRVTFDPQANTTTPSSSRYPGSVQTSSAGICACLLSPLQAI